MFLGLPARAPGLKVIIEEIDFGSSDTTVSKTVHASWVNSFAPPIAFIYGTSADHDPEDIVLEELKVTIGNIIHSSQFDIIVHAPNSTWGKYNILIFGAV